MCSLHGIATNSVVNRPAAAKSRQRGQVQGDCTSRYGGEASEDLDVSMEGEEAWKGKEWRSGCLSCPFEVTAPI